MQGYLERTKRALRQAIDEEWCALWWYYLEFDSILQPLHDDPEYRSMVGEVETRMVAQLRRVRAMADEG